MMGILDFPMRKNMTELEREDEVLRIRLNVVYLMMMKVCDLNIKIKSFLIIIIPSCIMINCNLPITFRSTLRGYC